jgi:hypothetical protein
MSIKRTMLAVAVAGALTAVTAVPSMALENEFHGLFRFRGIVSNFEDSASGGQAIGGQGGATNGKRSPLTSTYMEQRARLVYMAKANDDLKLVTQFEFDSRFGDNSYNSNSTTRNNGGGIGADQTNLETKNIYLDFKIPSTPVNMKVGIQGFVDNYKGIIFNNDAAGVTAAAKLGKLSLQGGYFRFDDATGTSATNNTYYGGANPTPSASNTTAVFGTTPATAGQVSGGTNAQVGNNTRDFMTLGGKYNISKDFVVGTDYYLLYSDILRFQQDKTYINMFGANAELKIGPATINGFALYQTGKIGTLGQNHQTLSAFAGNLAARAPVGPGTAKITTLYISGDRNSAGPGERNDFQTIMERGNTNCGHAFFESNSQLLLRNSGSTGQSDRAVVYDLNNNARGVVAAFVGYDLAIKKLFINSNVGIGAAAKDNANYNNGGVGSGTSNILGTELNTEIGYKLYENLTTSLQAAYLVLGDFYKTPAGTPDNPYSTKVMLTYIF